MKLGKRALDELAKRWAAARDNGGPPTRDLVWADEVPGFGVRRQEVGFAINFVLKYRVKGETRQRWLTLGAWPAVHPEAAREIKTPAALGRDLVAERRAEAERRAVVAAKAQRQGIPLAELLDAFRAALEAERACKMAEGRSGLHERELLRLEAGALRPAPPSAPSTRTRCRIERTFARTGRCRRLDRDREATVSSTTAFFVLAAPGLLRRLAMAS